MATVPGCFVELRRGKSGVRKDFLQIALFERIFEKQKINKKWKGANPSELKV
jgi:hypothetical protein